MHINCTFLDDWNKSVSLSFGEHGVIFFFQVYSVNIFNHNWYSRGCELRELFFFLLKREGIGTNEWVVADQQSASSLWRNAPPAPPPPPFFFFYVYRTRPVNMLDVLKLMMRMLVISLSLLSSFFSLVWCLQDKTCKQVGCAEVNDADVGHLSLSSVVLFLSLLSSFFSSVVLFLSLLSSFFSLVCKALCHCRFYKSVLRQRTSKLRKNLYNSWEQLVSEPPSGVCVCVCMCVCMHISVFVPMCMCVCVCACISF